MTWPLHTDRLMIRPATTGDADATWQFRRREDISRWLTRAPATLDEHRTWFEAPDNLAKTLVIQRNGAVIGDPHGQD
ncbi:GNAT family N-acetyltransferase [Micromonospora sp. STR1s_5]|nr:GNAT family N-acetyltransferase [Micromonospora sp. STR1s_5]